MSSVWHDNKKPQDTLILIYAIRNVLPFKCVFWIIDGLSVQCRSERAFERGKADWATYREPQKVYKIEKKNVKVE